MAKAASFALKASAQRGEISYATAATLTDRFSQFAEYARENGARYMEYVTRELVQEYGRELAEKVEAGEMSSAYAQNLVSAVNSVMTLATNGNWESVSPTRDCGIMQRSSVREEAPGALDREAYSRALDAVRDQLGDRVAAAVELMRELGLRSKEASLIDARAHSPRPKSAARSRSPKAPKAGGIGRYRSHQIARSRPFLGLQKPRDQTDP